MAERVPSQANDPSTLIKESEFTRPVVNIGSHPENEIVIKGEGILPFHAMLVAENGGYRLAALSPDAAFSLEGKPSRESSVSLLAHQRVSIGDYSIAVHQGATATAMRVALYQKPASQAPRVYIMENGEKAILMNVLSQLSEVDVEQPASYEVEVINAGPIVASFQLIVQGVPDEWVEITPPEINLNEGRRTTVRISITPPRASTSSAGKHPITLVATSPNYPGHTGEVQTDLTIRPYYAFSLGALSPKNQNIFWKARSGMVKLPIENQGNSETNFDVLTLDDENGCSFEYKLKEGVELSRQATITIGAGGSTILPMEISPIKRPMVAFRSKRYQYNTTVQATGQGVSPQMVSGSATSIPLFGWWSIVIAVLLLVLGLFILLQPRIYSFQVSAGKDIIELGDTTNLEWSVSPFAMRLNISGQDKPVESGQTHMTVNPTQSTIYELVAGNWLSGMMGLDQKALQTVLVVPPSPTIAAFDVNQTTVNKGLPVTLRWSVTKADKVLLTVGEVVTELTKDQFSGEKSVVLEKDTIVTLEAQSASGSELRSAFVKVVPPHITVNKFIVWVRPASTAIPGTATSSVIDETVPHLASLIPLETLNLASTPVPTPTPTITPVPTQSSAVTSPNADSSGDFPEKYVELIPDKSADLGYRVQFDQPKRQLSKGEQVMVEWEVDGTDTIAIAPFTDVLPAAGKQPFFPQQSMNFVMTAKSGELQKLFMLPVTVFDGTPPVAPTIQFFKGTPTTSVGATDVQFAWSVSGAWTHIQLKTGDTIVADWVNPQDFKTINVASSATYILTAWNGLLSTATPLDITINPTLKASTLTITDVYPHAGYFKVNDSVNVYVNLTNLPSGIAGPTGTVTVTDDYSTCPISLPVKFCTLKFTTPGTKSIKASYSGDAVYLPEDSAPYTAQTIVVVANKVNLLPTYHYLYNGTIGALINDLSTASILVGQGLDIEVSVTPVNSTMPVDTLGSVTVRQCPINSTTGLPDLSNCLSYGPAQVNVTTDTTQTNVGKAKVYLPYMQSKGNFGLLITYSHSGGAFDTTTLGSTADDKIPFTVTYGDLLLIPQGINPDDCTYTGGSKCIVHQGSSIDLAFTTKLMLKQKDSSMTSDIMLPLYSTFPKPNSLVVSAARVDALGNPVIDPISGKPIVTDWSSNCSWRIIDAKRELFCSGVDMTYPVKISYSFLGGGTDPKYSYDSNYSINETRSIPISVAVKKATTINFDRTAIDGKYVGQQAQLQGGGMNIYTYLTNDTPSTINAAVTYLKMQDGSKIGDVLKVASSALGSNPVVPSCFVDTSGFLELTQSADQTKDSCLVYFKKAGSFNFTLLYDPGSSSPNDSSTAPVAGVTINQQTGLSLGWNPAIATSYAVYDKIPSKTGDKITFNCLSTSTSDSCAGFNPAVLEAASIQFDTSAATSCKAYQNSTELTGGAINLPTTLTTVGVVQVMELDNIKFECTDEGTKTISVKFTGDSLSSFGFNASGTDSVSFDVGKISNSITPVIYRYTDAKLTETTKEKKADTSIKFNPILFGEVYKLSVTMDNMPSDMTPAAGDYAVVSWPATMATAMDASVSDCDSYKDSSNSNATTTVYNVPFTNALGTTWEASCKFSFTGSSTSNSTSIGAKQSMGFALNPNGRVKGIDNTSVTPNVTYPPSIDLTDSITKSNKTITPNVLLNDNASGKVEMNTSGTTYSMKDPFYLREVYDINVTLGDSIPSDADMTGSNIVMTWPAAFDSLLVANPAAPCSAQGSGKYKMTFSQGDTAGTWTTKCEISFKSLADSTFDFSANFIYLELSSDRYTADIVKIALYSKDSKGNTAAGIQKESPTMTVAIALPSGTTKPTGSGDADKYYAKSKPMVEVTLTDNNYHANVIDDLTPATPSTDFTINLNGVSGYSGDLTCAGPTSIDSGTATATLDCTIPSDSYYPLSSGNIQYNTVTVTYKGSSTFATAKNTSKQESIVGIPIIFNLSDLHWYDAGDTSFNSPHAFPELMACNSSASPCSSKDLSQYYLKRLISGSTSTLYKYHLSIPVTVDPSVQINGSTPTVGPSTGTVVVPGGKITVQITNADKSRTSSYSGTVSDNRATFDFSVSNDLGSGFPPNYNQQASLYCPVQSTTTANDYTMFYKKTTCATTLNLSYSDSNSVSSGPTKTDSSHYIYIKDELIFSVDASQDGFTITPNYSTKVCVDVYVQNNGTSNPDHCEAGSSCWHRDYNIRGDGNTGTYNKDDTDNVALGCNNDTEPSGNWSWTNPYGCNDDSNNGTVTCFQYYNKWTSDTTLAWSLTSNEFSALKFQLYLTSPYYIGSFFSSNWP